jgi:hypothetical protein
MKLKFQISNSCPELAERVKFQIKDGFTIIELLLYQGLLMIFLVVLTEIFLSALDIQLGQQSSSNIQQDGSYIISRLIYDINRASAICKPLTIGSSNETLQLAINSSTCLDPYLYSYSSDGTNLILTTSGNPDPLNGYDTQISHLNFLRLGNSGKVEDTITVKFTLTSKIAIRNFYESRDFQTTVSKRRN